MLLAVLMHLSCSVIDLRMDVYYNIIIVCVCA